MAQDEAGHCLKVLFLAFYVNFKVNLTFQIFKGLVADATLYVYFSYFITYIYSITLIQYIYLSPFAEASLRFLIACMLSGAEPRIELGPALQQAEALQTKPRLTITKPRRNITKPRRTISKLTELGRTKRKYSTDS